MAKNTAKLTHFDSEDCLFVDRGVWLAVAMSIITSVTPNDVVRLWAKIDNNKLWNFLAKLYLRIRDLLYTIFPSQWSFGFELMFDGVLCNYQNS